MDYCCIPACHDTKVVPVATIDNLCKSGMLMEAQNLLIVHAGASAKPYIFLVV